MSDGSPSYCPTSPSFCPESPTGVGDKRKASGFLGDDGGLLRENAYMELVHLFENVETIELPPIAKLLKDGVCGLKEKLAAELDLAKKSKREIDEKIELLETSDAKLLDFYLTHLNA